ncbi:hypothetical protein ABNG30_32235 [Bacillus thuringiensis]
MVRRRAVIRLEKQRKSEDRFSVIRWEVHINLGKRNYKTKDIFRCVSRYASHHEQSGKHNDGLVL